MSWYPDDAMADSVQSRPSLSQIMLNSLVRAIVRGDFAGEAEFPTESEIAATFRVSKPTARETLKLVQALGLVEIAHGRRTAVTAMTEWDVLAPSVAAAFKAEGRGAELARQYWQLRQVIERSCASLAAAHATAAERDDIIRLANEMRRAAVVPGNIRTILDLDRDFHDVIGRASRNLALRRVATLVHHFLAWSSDSKLKPELFGILVDQHAAIAQAIARADAAGAAKAMDQHIDWAKDIEAASE